jgi:DNA-directed RNA polymerase specialized sigma24 family protein
MRAVLAYAVGVVRATRWARDQIPPEGQEAADLVQEAIRRVIEGKRQWPPGVALDQLLMGIVRSLVSHLANSPENRHDRLTDGLVDKGEGLPPETAPLPTPEELTMQRQACEGLVGEAFAAADGDPVLGKIIEAVADGHMKAAEIAEATGLRPQQVHKGTWELHQRLGAKAAGRSVRR